MRCRSIVVLIAFTALLAPIDSAVAQRGGRGGRSGPDLRSQPPAPAIEDKAPDRPATSPGPQFGLALPEVLEAIDRGQGREALAFYERAAAAAETRGDHPSAGRAHAAIAFAATRLGMIQKSIRAGTRALELLKGLASPDLVSTTAGVFSNLGGAYRAAGDLAQARRYFEEGLSFVKAGTRRREASMHAAHLGTGLASVAQRQGDLPAALSSATEAARLFDAFLASLGPRANERVRETGRRNAARNLVLLARVQIAMSRFDDAESTLKDAHTFAGLVGLIELDVEILNVAGDLAFRRDDFAQALDLYRQAVAQATRINRTSALIALYQGVARSAAGLGRLDESLAASERAIAVIEEVRSELQESGLRSGFVEDKQGIYHLAVQTALRQGKAAQAFGFAESARARAFLDLLGNQTTLSKGKTRALVDEEVRLRARLAEARALAQEVSGEGEGRRAREVVEAADHDYRAFLERVRKESLEQASLMSVEPVSLSEVQGLLPEGTTLLEYLVSGRGVVVWIVDRQRAKALTIPGDRTALITEVRQLRAAIADQAPLTEVQRLALVLHQRLLGNARREIRGDRLLIVPHDVLHYVPFAALRSPEGRWLIEDYALATLPSASVLKYLAGKGAAASAGALAVGNPDLGAGLNLRWAEREARLLGQRVGTATVLVRAEASEARAKPLLSGAGLIHFATHGELNEADPLSSGLLLVPGGGEDGRLEVRELFGLDLTARLVVLSACETGLGKLSRGDELVGLQRAFLYAGTPAVITTLWKVDDRASYELIRVFYERLATDGPVQGLRQAQLATLRAFPHPFAWAAFGFAGAPP